MDDFKNNTLSTFLIEAIKAKGYSIEKLAEETGVSEQYISFLLEENYEKLPPAPYLRGYVLKISQALDIDGEKLWEAYFKDRKQLRTSGLKDKLPENRFAIKGGNKKVILIGLLILAAIAYFVINLILSFDITRELTLLNIESDTTLVDEPNFVVRGAINPDHQLTINDEIILPDETGNFEKILNLQEGFNTVEFKVKGFLGKEDSVVRQIFYEPVEEEEVGL